MASSKPLLPTPIIPIPQSPKTLEPRNGQRSLNSPPRSPRRDFLTSSDNNSSAGSSSRGSIAGVQNRRSGVSMGLGVSFAPFPATDLVGGDVSPLSPHSTTSTSSHSLNLNSTMISRPQSRSVSRSHSRRSSIAFPSTTSPNSELDNPHQFNINNTTSTTTSTSSNRPSRRPSLSHLASFLSGIEHHTRVRNPGVGGGRGVSRSASRSQSRAGERRGTRDSSVGTFGEDGVETLHSPFQRTASVVSLAGSRASSIAPQSRRSSINGIPIGYGYPNSGTGSSNEGVERSVGSLWEVEERGTVREDESELGLRTPISSPSLNQHQQLQQGITRVFHPPSTPRIYSTETDEEPYLETAPSSPQPRRTRTHDSFSNGLEDVDVFDEGDRVGVGVWLEGRGGWARDCFGEENDSTPGNGIGGPGELEVVRRLGEGTYAIVYLVREVLYDPEQDPEDALSPIDAYSSFQYFGDNSANSTTLARPPARSWSSDPFAEPQEPVYGRNFALKCLCKKDLTDELIEVQRGEAILHRALPDHEYIVRLYGAYETDDWLFLVLEYCPGQDLFYFLSERQDDSAALYDAQHQSRTASPFGSSQNIALPTLAMDSEDESQLSRTVTSHHGEIDRTPPSPSLLSTTANASLLSRKRLRLISRMFGQMCSAVQICHEAGIAHRDIKPENFIVMDGRNEAESGMGRVVVKITDWGLGTTETDCEDFDCGSKPYMAYECRNNLQATYDPRQADVWSLGLVLLNLLYHRNPWADPSLDDPDFSEYVSDPRGFLESRFEGIGEEVAGFLADRVFCDVLEMEGEEKRRRVSAGDFGKWAGRLVMMMGEGKRKRASVSDHTFQLFPGPSRATAAATPTVPSKPTGLLSQFASSLTTSPHSSPQSILLGSPITHNEEFLPEIEEGKIYSPPIIPTPTFDSNSTSTSNFNYSLDDDSPLPSPSFPPYPLPPLPVAEIEVPTIESLTIIEEANTFTESTIPIVSLPISASAPLSDVPELNNVIEDDGDEGGEIRCWGEPESLNPKSKRRKRGARKGKLLRTPGETSPTSPSPLSPSSPLVLPSSVGHRDRVLDDLASASQELARELSKTSRSFGTQSSPALYPSSPARKIDKSIISIQSNYPSLPEKKKASEGVFGRMKNMVKDGNPDLQAFKKRVEERNAMIGAKADTYSAPAKMQGIGRASVETGMSSRGSAGNASWGSYSAAEMDGSRSRGSNGTVEGTSNGGGTWSSSSSRRERLDKQRNGPGEFSPSSSTRKTLSTTGFDSRTHTPLSSFSSVASTPDPLPSHSLATVRDWRQPSNTTRGVSSSRPIISTTTTSPTLTPIPHHTYPNSQLAKKLPATLASKPKYRDASTDTTDLINIPITSSSSSSTTPPILLPSLALAPKLSSSSSIKATRSGSRGSNSSASTTTATATEIPSVQATKTTKFSKMLSVFNR